MASTPSPFLPASSAAPLDVRFIWDDTRASLDFPPEPLEAERLVAQMTERAASVLGVGVFEWIVWRFSRVNADPTPSDVLEAAWCACVDRRYMIYTEYSREDWVGPVRGPLWCAMTWLIPMVLMGDEDPEEVVSGLSYLSRLAMHVIPESAGFRAWLEGCAIRLAQQYPQQPVSAFTDLFGELSEARRGPYVAREALDLSRPYDPDSSSALMQGFLQTVDPDRNPLLRSAADLIDIGYQGVPYGAPIPWPPVQ